MHAVKPSASTDLVHTFQSRKLNNRISLRRKWIEVTTLLEDERQDNNVFSNLRYWPLVIMELA